MPASTAESTAASRQAKSESESRWVTARAVTGLRLCGQAPTGPANPGTAWLKEPRSGADEGEIDGAGAQSIGHLMSDVTQELASPAQPFEAPSSAAPVIRLAHARAPIARPFPRLPRSRGWRLARHGSQRAGGRFRCPGWPTSDPIAARLARQQSNRRRSRGRTDGRLRLRACRFIGHRYVRRGGLPHQPEPAVDLASSQPRGSGVGSCQRSFRGADRPVPRWPHWSSASCGASGSLRSLPSSSVISHGTGSLGPMAVSSAAAWP